MRPEQAGYTMSNWSRDNDEGNLLRPPRRRKYSEQGWPIRSVCNQGVVGDETRCARSTPQTTLHVASQLARPFPCFVPW